MATYVLVHGGAHGGWCYKKVARLLREQGHEVHTPTMTGVGERAHLLGPHVDLDLHVADVVNVLHWEDLRDVVLVGHSYGGMVITGVADRARGRVGHLVYLDAAIPADGEAMIASTPPAINEAFVADLRTVDGVELTLWPTYEAGRAYGVSDPDDLAWMQARLTPHPWKTFTQPLHFDPVTVGKIPRTNINCTEILANRPPEFKGRALDAENVWEIDTGHDLMITEPKAVADMLGRLARP